VRAFAALPLLVAVSTTACEGWFGPPPNGPMHVTLIEIASKGDALATSDALEALIADGKDTPTDREFALKSITLHPQPGAGYAFARAAVTGRVVQSRQGISGLGLVGDVARWGELSRKLDPEFREGAATRLLGTLYTQAPSSLLPNGGGPEQGLEMLEGLVRKHPLTPENHLRLAEALVFQNDADSATPHICWCTCHRAELRRDDQILLDHVIADAHHPTCAPCPPARPPAQPAVPPAAQPAAQPAATPSAKP
jgi:hypothetical protein